MPLLKVSASNTFATVDSFLYAVDSQLTLYEFFDIVTCMADIDRLTFKAPRKYDQNDDFVRCVDTFDIKLARTLDGVLRAEPLPFPGVSRIYQMPST